MVMLLRWYINSRQKCARPLKYVYYFLSHDREIYFQFLWFITIPIKIQIWHNHIPKSLCERTLSHCRIYSVDELVVLNVRSLLPLISFSIEIWLWNVWFIFMICYILFGTAKHIFACSSTPSRLTYPHPFRFCHEKYILLVPLQLATLAPLILSLWFAIFLSPLCLHFLFVCLCGNLLSLSSSTLHFTALDSTNEYIQFLRQI